jgi:hypothetical protein
MPRSLLRGALFDFVLGMDSYKLFEDADEEDGIEGIT